MNKIAVISMVRNEQDIIESFVRHSLSFADVILIMNHNSTDKTGVILEKLAEEGLPVIAKPFMHVEHAQAEVMDMLLQEAVEDFQADIILPLDADEFLVNTETEASCREILQRLSPQDVYRLRWRTYIPSSDEGGKATFVPWRTVKRNQQDDAGNKVILGAAVYRRQCCRVAQGNHYAYTGPAEKPRRLQDREIPMLHLAHFPWRSHEQYASKVSSGWLNNIAKYSRHTSIATHYQKYFHRLEAGKEIGPEDFVQNPETFSLQRYMKNQELRYTPSGKVPVLQNLLATGVEMAQAFLEEKVRQEASLVTVLAADGGDETEWQAMQENVQAQTWTDIEIVRWASNMSREELSRKVHGKYIQWLLPGERMQPARIARLAASLAVNPDVDAVVTEIRADDTIQEGCVDLSFLPKDELVILDGEKVAAYMEEAQGFLADKRFASFFCRREVMEECGWLPQEVAAVLRQPDARQTMLSLWQRALRQAASLGLLRVCYLKPVRDFTQRYQMAAQRYDLAECAAICAEMLDAGQRTPYTIARMKSLLFGAMLACEHHDGSLAEKYLSYFPEDVLPQINCLPDCRYWKGRAAYEQKQWEQAIRFLQQQTQVKPEDELSWFFLGNAWYHQGDYVQALAAYIEALEINEFFVECTANAAVVLRALGEREEAEKLCQPSEVQEILPENGIVETPQDKCLQHYLRQPDKIFDIPIFINSRDRLGCLKKLISWLQEAGYRRICIIDNASTYPPLLQYYQEIQKTGVELILLSQNLGYKAIWTAGILKQLKINSPYVYTDSDIVPQENCPKDILQQLLRGLWNHPWAKKAGLALRIDDITFYGKEEMQKKEAQFYYYPLGEKAFFAPVDTTFALYRNYRHYSLQEAIRIGGGGTALHLPWYYDYKNLPADEQYYMEHADNSSSLVNDLRGEK